MAQATCSFCGRDKKDVDLMISGIHAHICDKCIIQAQQILNEEVKTKIKQAEILLNGQKIYLLDTVDWASLF